MTLIFYNSLVDTIWCRLYLKEPFKYMRSSRDRIFEELFEYNGFLTEC